MRVEGPALVCRLRDALAQGQQARLNIADRKAYDCMVDDQ
jgi:hypothetical protein